jgi:8-oxo-dGTP pyrophosphatase MutT (NUDIX family)
MTSDRRQRVAAYALTFDEHDQVLLVLAGPDDSNMWFLPGGGVEFGEHPEECLRREVMEETGQEVQFLALTRVVSDAASVKGDVLHSIRIIYRASLSSGRELRAEVDGSSVGVQWVPMRRALELKLAPFVRTCLEDVAEA